MKPHGLSRRTNPRTRSQSGTTFTTGISAEPIFTMPGVAFGACTAATSSKSVSLKSFRSGFTLSKDSSPCTAVRSMGAPCFTNGFSFCAHPPPVAA